MNKININKFKKLFSVIALFYAIAVSNKIQAYPHIPLKGLFKVLKKDDIGFGHALLHSGWIENMYQYGEGKPHRKVPIKNGRDTTWKAEKKGDAIANLVRKFWFRASENHQLLPTQFGCLATIDNTKLGTVFGTLINCVYKNLGPDVESELIDAVISISEDSKLFRQELTALWSDIIDQEYELRHGKKFHELRTFRKAQDQRFKQITKELEEQFNIAELKQGIALLRQAFLSPSTLPRIGTQQEQDEKKLKRSNTICGNKIQHAIQLLEHKLLIFPGIDTRLFQASTHENAISSYPSKHLFAR